MEWTGQEEALEAELAHMEKRARATGQCGPWSEWNGLGSRRPWEPNLPRIMEWTGQEEALEAELA